VYRSQVEDGWKRMASGLESTLMRLTSAYLNSGSHASEGSSVSSKGMSSSPGSGGVADDVEE